MLNFTSLFGGGDAFFALVQQLNFFDSYAWTATCDGIVLVRAMGAGGSGNNDFSGSNDHIIEGTGGYSGSWGVKVLRVFNGDVVTVLIGAGGRPPVGLRVNGLPGGDTVVTHRGVDYIAYGGPGGVNRALLPLPPGPLPSENWDVRIASVAPGGKYGAGVDIVGMGGVVSKGNEATSGKTGVLWGANPLTDGLGPGGSNEWGINFQSSSEGSNGVGQLNSNLAGLGAGGGARKAPDRGGNGYAHLKFFAKIN